MAIYCTFSNPMGEDNDDKMKKYISLLKHSTYIFFVFLMFIILFLPSILYSIINFASKRLVSVKRVISSEGNSVEIDTKANGRGTVVVKSLNRERIKEFCDAKEQ